MNTITAAITATLTAALITALVLTREATPSADALMFDCLSAGLSAQECREGIF